jgi:hypothetical protein
VIEGCCKDGRDVDARAGLAFPSQQYFECFWNTVPSVLATRWCGRGLSETLTSFQQSILWHKDATWEDFMGSQGAKCGGAIVCISVGYTTIALQDHDEEPGSGLHVASLHEKSLYLAVEDSKVLASAHEHDPGVPYVGPNWLHLCVGVHGR